MTAPPMPSIARSTACLSVGSTMGFLPGAILVLPRTIFRVPRDRIQAVSSAGDAADPALHLVEHAPGRTRCRHEAGFLPLVGDGFADDSRGMERALALAGPQCFVEPLHQGTGFHFGFLIGVHRRIVEGFFPGLAAACGEADGRCVTHVGSQWFVEFVRCGISQSQYAVASVHFGKRSTSHAVAKMRSRSCCSRFSLLYAFGRIENLCSTVPASETTVHTWVCLPYSARLPSASHIQNSFTS